MQAPGTFGFDGTKYRPPRGDFESIPMDEFGRPAQQNYDDVYAEAERPVGLQTIHDDVQLPHRQQSPSPAPFSHYAPTNVQQANPTQVGLQPGQGASHSKQKTQQKDDDDEAGCCKCVIM